MGVNDTTKIVLGSLRYKASPNTVLSVNVDLNQNEKELIEFRTIKEIVFFTAKY